jgi:hypothetical protein
MSLPAHSSQELPRRKHVVTQERSRVIQETANPFVDEDEDDDRPEPAQASTAYTPVWNQTNPPVVQSFSASPRDAKAGKTKDKKSKKGKKARVFNLEAEQEQMKVDIAEAAMAATNLMNTLQTINRERERISENQLALQRFETCKQLRRKILRYVSVDISCLPSAPQSS